MATDLKYSRHLDKSKIYDASHLHFGLVVSQWNPNITHALSKGAHKTLSHYGVLTENIISWEVPGSFELPFACKKMAQTHNMDAIIAIGCVIQGETKHFDYVCQAVSQGIKDLNLTLEIPVIFCVLTDNTYKQSEERSGGKLGNKGVEAALSAIQMAFLSNNE